MKARKRVFEKIYKGIMEVLMNNRLLQICTALVFVAAAAFSAHAQNARNYRAEIPFDFSVGKESHRAGEYMVVVNNAHSSPILEIRQKGAANIQLAPASLGFNRSEKNVTKLVFTKYDDEYFLSEIISTDFGLKMRKPNLKDRLAKKPKVKPESVSVILTRQDKTVE
jgi:hypothetical protein